MSTCVQLSALCDGKTLISELRYFGIAFHHRSLAILGVGGVQHEDSPHGTFLASVRIKPPPLPLPPCPKTITHIPKTVVIRASTMAIPIKASLLALILLLTPLSSGEQGLGIYSCIILKAFIRLILQQYNNYSKLAGMAEGFKDGTSPIYLLHKVKYADKTLIF